MARVGVSLFQALAGRGAVIADLLPHQHPLPDNLAKVSDDGFGLRVVYATSCFGQCSDKIHVVNRQVLDLLGVEILSGVVVVLQGAHWGFIPPWSLEFLNGVCGSVREHAANLIDPVRHACVQVFKVLGNTLVDHRLGLGQGFHCLDPDICRHGLDELACRLV